MTTLSYQLD